MNIPARYPGLLTTVPMAEHLTVGVTPRGAPERTYIEVDPNHCVLHFAVDIDHSEIEANHRLIQSGGIPAECRPANSEHGGALASVGGVYVQVNTAGELIMSPGQPRLTEFIWMVGKIRYTRRAG